MKIINKEEARATAYFQDLVGIIKIGLKDTQMRKDAPDKYWFRLGMFFYKLNEENKHYHYYETFEELCKKEFSFSPRRANCLIKNYKNQCLHKI